jgi:hypothetical protein
MIWLHGWTFEAAYTVAIEPANSSRLLAGLPEADLSKSW